MRSSPDPRSEVDALPSYDPGPLAPPDENWYGRRGRLSTQRIDDFTRLYARFGLATHHAVDRWRPEVLEIGFGFGEAMLALAAEDRTSRILGVETFGPGVLALMRGLEEAAIDNVRVARANVLTVLPQLPAGELSLVRIFFPDPWPKRRHAARRLVRHDLVARVVELLGPGGVLHVATDITPYAREVGALLRTFDALTPITAPGRASTRFEAHAVHDGRPVHDLAWRKRVS